MTDIPVWDDGAWQGFEPLGSDTVADLCVVGLGGSGLAAVSEGLEAGLNVVGIDAGPVAGEAAGRNGGFLLAGMPLFYHQAVERWGNAPAVYQMTLDEMQKIMRQPGTRQVGSLRIADTDAELADIEAETAALRRDSFPVETYAGPEGEGLLLPADGTCNPMLRCRSMALDLASSGARLFEHTKAESIETGRVVTSRGVISAETIVVAIDGRLELLFPDVEVTTARLEMLATAPVPERTRRPVYTAYGYIYWQQLPGGEIALGGLRDRFAEHSWSTDPGPTDDVQRALDGYLAEMGVDAPVTHRWAGHAAYTLDRTPIFTEHSHGVWVIGGYSGHGNVLGAVYGRAAVRAALGESVSLL